MEIGALFDRNPHLFSAPRALQRQNVGGGKSAGSEPAESAIRAAMTHSTAAITAPH